MKGAQLYSSSGSEADEQNLLSCSKKVRKELGPFKANRLPRDDKAESEFKDSVLKTAIEFVFPFSWLQLYDESHQLLPEISERRTYPG
jgi:hypothetical protein